MEFDLKSILRIIRLENVIKCCMCLLAACMRVLHDVVFCVCNQLFAQFCPMANGAHLMRFNANRTFRDANNILHRKREILCGRERNNASWSPPLRPHETLVICRAINYAQVLIIFPFSILPFCFYPNYIFRPVATLPWLLSKANVGRPTVHSSPLRLAPMIISSAKHISVSGYSI